MIYNIDFNFIWTALMVPQLRKQRMLAWGRVLLKPLQVVNDLIFNNYANGTNNADWDLSTAYVVGDIVVYKNRIVYQCIVNNTNQVPTNTLYWRQILDNYIGVYELLKYNSQKMTFEYALNRWFQSIGIFIQNNDANFNTFWLANSSELSGTLANNSINQTNYLSNGNIPISLNHFTIYVPIAVYNNISPIYSNIEPIIRSFADRYVLAGMIYDIQTY